MHKGGKMNKYSAAVLIVLFSTVNALAHQTTFDVKQIERFGRITFKTTVAGKDSQGKDIEINEHFLVETRFETKEEFTYTGPGAHPETDWRNLPEELKEQIKQKYCGLIDDSKWTDARLGFAFSLKDLERINSPSRNLDLSSISQKPEKVHHLRVKSEVQYTEFGKEQTGTSWREVSCE